MWVTGFKFDQYLEVGSEHLLQTFRDESQGSLKQIPRVTGEANLLSLNNALVVIQR